MANLNHRGNFNSGHYSPGDFFGSIIPPLLTRGMKETLQKSEARKVYVCNLVTKQGTGGFKASDFIKSIEKHTMTEIDFTLCNSKEPSKSVVDKYRNEKSEFVEPDTNDNRTIKLDLLIEIEKEGKIFARHDSGKTAGILMSLVKG